MHVFYHSVFKVFELFISVLFVSSFNAGYFSKANIFCSLDLI